MEHWKRLRRTALICSYTLANFAYYRAASEIRPMRGASRDFQRRATANFLDIGVLEWCKIFGGKNDKHHWRKVISGDDLFKDAWLAELLTHLALTTEMFDAYVKEMRTYRDKFIAHLDDEETMRIPNLTPAIKSTQRLMQHLVNEESPKYGNALADAPTTAVAHYRALLAHGRENAALMHSV